MQIFIRNIFTCVTLCVVAQFLTIAHGLIDRFLWGRFFINFCVAYPVACLLGLTVPAPSFGVWVCRILHISAPALRKIVFTLSVNLIYTIILSSVMTFLNVILLNGQNASAFFSGITGNFLPMWLSGSLASLLIVEPLMNAITLLCGNRG